MKKMLCLVFAATLGFVVSAVPLWPEAGAYREIDTGWNQIAGMTALDGKLYIISGDGLFEVDTK